MTEIFCCSKIGPDFWHKWGIEVTSQDQLEVLLSRCHASTLWQEPLGNVPVFLKLYYNRLQIISPCESDLSSICVSCVSRTSSPICQLNLFWFVSYFESRSKFEFGVRTMFLCSWKDKGYKWGNFFPSSFAWPNSKLHILCHPKSRDCKKSQQAFSIEQSTRSLCIFLVKYMYSKFCLAAPPF